jgi:uncharacterized protein (UPF0332 family)
VDSERRVLLARALNELELARIIQKVSDEPKLQAQVFGLKPDIYYSGTIAHAYYGIFFSAKAYLLGKGIQTRGPNVHAKTLNQFALQVIKGDVDIEMLKVYRSAIIRADALLQIFDLEKGKRGHYTYRKIRQAEQIPAQESIKNATIFISRIMPLCAT